MQDLWQGVTQAVWLLISLDADLVEISLRSLQVTLSALVIASLIALPLAALLSVRRFWMRRAVIWCARVQRRYPWYPRRRRLAG